MHNEEAVTASVYPSVTTEWICIKFGVGWFYTKSCQVNFVLVGIGPI
jgi:hypothetical protein